MSPKLFVFAGPIDSVSEIIHFNALSFRIFSNFRGFGKGAPHHGITEITLY